MQLTAREWIELIADPEKKKKIVDIVNKYPDLPNIECANIKMAVMWAIDFTKAPEKEIAIWVDVCANPPALLPFPNKEQEQAEALFEELKRFAKEKYGDMYHDEEDLITDFLNQKYPS